MNIFSHVAGCAVIVSVVLGQGLGDGLDFKHQEATQPSQPAGISARGDRVDVPSQSSEQPDTSPGTWECWTPLQTVPCNHNLFVVDALSETDAWAAGEAGTFMHWDGIAWEPVPSSTLANLHAIDMLSTTDGWAAGSGVILHWDGNVWTEVENPSHAVLTSLAMVGPTDGWGVDPDSPIMHWNGSAWTPTAHTGDDELYAVSMASAVDGWAVGGFLNPWGNYDNPVAWHWDGQTWTSVALPLTSSYMEYLSAVDVISSDDAWAVGGGYASPSGYFSTILHWDGESWTRMPSPTSVHLTVVAMSSPVDGWASGRGYNSTTGETGVPSPTSRRISVVSLASPASGWAVGAGGAILRFTGPTSAVQLYLPLIEHG